MTLSTLRSRGLLVLLLSVAVAALALAAVPADLFRYSRAISVAPGWARLPIPDDVLDACRSGLPDLRIVDAASEEVPWALEDRIGSAATRIELRDVERVPGRETTAMADRGPHPAAASGVTLVIDGEDYLKPLVIESSDDRKTWRAIASGSVFSTRRTQSTTLRFPPNDRQWWRFRFDDRNGDPVSPRQAILRTRGAEPDLREVPLALSAAAPENGARTVTLPAGNLGIVALRIEAAGQAFSRRVRVTERVFFHGELLRRPVGEGLLARSANGTDASNGNDVIPIGDSSARSLEIEVERLDGPALVISRVIALARPRAILFSAPEGASLRLLYGSVLAEPPRYDLERALAKGRPRDGEVSIASLGAPQGAAAPAFPLPARGELPDAASWKRRQPIVLPTSGNVAYLDLSGPAGQGPGTPRLLDGGGRQVPYVLERAAHRERQPASIRDASSGSKTIVELEQIHEPASIDTVELTASGPAYFSRQAVVQEAITDARGEAGTRILGSSSWEKKSEDAFSPLAIGIQRPSAAQIRVVVENGDNARLTVGSAAVWSSVPRIDFVFAPGEKLTLLSGNEAASAPAYDLDLVAARVLSSPALPAGVAAPARGSSGAADGKASAPGWIWIAIAVAAVLVVVVLARSLRA